MTRPGDVHVPYLRGWRAHKGLTQEALADKAGVTRTTIIRAENGRALNAVTLAKVAKALEITVYDLRSTDPDRL